MSLIQLIADIKKTRNIVYQSKIEVPEQKIISDNYINNPVINKFYLYDNNLNISERHCKKISELIFLGRFIGINTEEINRFELWEDKYYCFQHPNGTIRSVSKDGKKCFLELEVPSIISSQVLVMNYHLDYSIQLSNEDLFLIDSFTGFIGFDL